MSLKKICYRRRTVTEKELSQKKSCHRKRAVTEGELLQKKNSDRKRAVSFVRNRYGSVRAGGGNRTRLPSLGSWYSTDELHLRILSAHLFDAHVLLYQKELTLQVVLFKRRSQVVLFKRCSPVVLFRRRSAVVLFECCSQVVLVERCSSGAPSRSRT